MGDVILDLIEDFAAWRIRFSLESKPKNRGFESRKRPYAVGLSGSMKQSTTS